MTAQLPLPFEAHKLAHRRDPDTSRASAAGCRELRSEHHLAILAVLGAAAVPLTAEAIGLRCGLSMVQAARRMRELVDGGLVVVDGEGVTVSGRRAQSYRLASKEAASSAGG